MSTTRYNTVRDPNLATSVAGAAVDGDSIVLSQGSDIYSAGINMPTIDLALFQGTAGFSGDVGTAASPAVFDCNNNAGGNGLFVNGSASRNWFIRGGDTKIFSEVQVHPVSGGRTFFSNATITVGYQATGYFSAADSVAASDWYQLGGESVWDKGAGALTNLWVHAGLARISRTLTKLTLRAGGTAKVEDESCTPGTVDMNGGTLQHQGLNITTINGYAGIVDFRRVTRDIVVATLNHWETLTILMPLSGARVAFTANNPKGRGAKFVYPP